MKLEEYIRKNRQLIDTEKPDEDFIWTGISQNLDKKKRIVSLSLWKLAVAAMVVFAVSYSIVSNQFSQKNSQLIFVKIDPELAKQEAQMVKQINLYYDELSNTKHDVEKMVTHYADLDQIDTLILRYAEDLKTKGPNPRILNNLMDLYHKKAKVLNRILNEIEKNERYEKHTASI